MSTLSSSSSARLVPLPTIFYSASSGKPFTHCIECERPFLEETDYFVEKAIRRYPKFDLSDTIFEYAMCVECAARLASTLSRSSVAVLNQYFTAHVDIESRALWLANPEKPDPQQWLRACVIKGTSAEEFAEYQIMAHCRGNSLVISLLPYLIGEDALHEMISLLSTETLDVMSNFSDKHFGLPPEFNDVPRTRFMPML